MIKFRQEGGFFLTMDKKTAILLLIVFIDMIGFGIVIPILPLMIERVGGGTFLVGVIIAIFSLFQFLFSPILGRLSDKYGRKPILFVSSFINAASYFLIFLSQQMWVVLLARIVAGVGSANISVAQAYIADTSAAHERTKKLGLVGAVFGLGFIVGPLLGGLVSAKFSIAAVFLVPAVLSLVNTVLIYFVLSESNKSFQKHIKIELFNVGVMREVMKPKNIAFLMLLFFFVNFALSLIIGVFSLLGQAKFGWTEAQNGYYFGLIGLSSFLTQAFLIRALLKKIDEVGMIKVGLAVFSVSIILMGLSPWVFLMIIVGLLTPFAVSLLMVNTQSLISLESKPEEQGIVMGAAQSFAALGRVFGPLIGGAIAVVSLNLPFILSGIVTIMVLVFGNSYLKFVQNGKKPQEHTAK